MGKGFPVKAVKNIMHVSTLFDHKENDRRCVIILGGAIKYQLRKQGTLQDRISKPLNAVYRATHRTLHFLSQLLRWKDNGFIELKETPFLTDERFLRTILVCLFMNNETVEGKGTPGPESGLLSNTQK